MNREEFLEFVSKNFNIGGDAMRLIDNILQYAEKLGLTPAGRVRLAQKRAAAAEAKDPDGDLFGD